MGKSKLFLGLTFGLFGFLFLHLSLNMLQIRPDGWYVGQVNLYGDLVYHLSLINKFMYSNTISIDNPIFAGTKVDYPIFADALTAYIAIFTNIQTALVITTFLAGILSIYTARLFIRRFIKNEKVIFLSLLLFFVNGGFGFYYFFKDLATSQKPFFDFLLSMPNQYTDIKDRGYWWINNYLAYFLPQRTFLFAFPITLAILILLYIATRKETKKYFVLAGLLAGLLPLVQVQSLFLLFLLCLFYVPFNVFSSKNKKQTILNWLIFAFLTGFIGFAMFSSISSGQNALKSIRFEPGWTSKENILWFWLKNLGVFGPTLIIALIWLFKKNRHLFKLYLPFLMVFFLCNILVFQPWSFDNSKFLVYWYFVSSIVVAAFLYDQFFGEKIWRKAIGIILVFLMIFAGSLDLIRTFTPVTSYQIYSNQDLQAAQIVKNLTPQNAIFVTASNHNNPIPTLTGRSTLLGFPGWLWTHGISYQERTQDVTKIYLGGNQADKLITKYKVNYVSIGPAEKAEFNPNEIYFQKFPSLALGYNWHLYDVSNIWTNSKRKN